MEEIGMNTESLQLIVAGRKTIEGRLATPRFLKLQVGDEISIREDIWKNGEIIESRTNAANIVITHVDRFDTFRDMLVSLGFKNVRPADENLETALLTYRRYYSHGDEHQYGVVGISFRLK